MAFRLMTRGASRCERLLLMRHLTSILVLGLLVRGEAFGAQDGFNGVHCGADIPRALRGSSMSDETVVAIESRHRDLGLKDLGADELEKGWSLISWRICGDEFMLIVDDRSRVRDVLKVPAHSRSRPESTGPCTMNGAEIPGEVVAILDQKDGAKDLPAISAWRVDEKAGRFVPLPTTGLLCARAGILAADGGG
jgi:hypothetical protein